jgi:hypothetical protein
LPAASRTQSTSNGCSSTRRRRRWSACSKPNTTSTCIPGLVDLILLAASMFAHAFMMFVADSFRCHVPESVQSHIDYITPGVKLLELDDTNSSRRKMKKRSPDDSMTLFSRALDLDLGEMLENGLPGCDVVISPDCIRNVSPSSFRSF